MKIIQLPYDDIILDPGGSIILGTSKFESPIQIPIDQHGYFFINFVPDRLEYFAVRRVCLQKVLDSSFLKLRYGFTSHIHHLVNICKPQNTILLAA